MIYTYLYIHRYVLHYMMVLPFDFSILSRMYQVNEKQKHLYKSQFSIPKSFLKYPKQKSHM